MNRVHFANRTCIVTLLHCQSYCLFVLNWKSISLADDELPYQETFLGESPAFNLLTAKNGKSLYLKSDWRQSRHLPRRRYCVSGFTLLKKNVALASEALRFTSPLGCQEVKLLGTRITARSHNNEISYTCCGIWVGAVDDDDALTYEKVQ